MQLSVNCRIRHCRVCCLVLWAAPSNHVPAQRDILATATSPRVQHHANEAAELCRTCASLVGRSVILFYLIILFYYGAKWRSSYASIFYFIANTLMNRLRKNEIKRLETVEMCIWRRVLKISWTEHKNQ